MRMSFCLLFSLLLLTACASDQPAHDPASVTPAANASSMTDEEYATAIQKLTVRDRKYEGFYQIFEASALMINSEAQNILLRRQGHFYQWDAAKLRTEKERYAQLNSTQTRVILSFFSPDFQYDDLSKQNTVWHIYLEGGGGRFEAKVKKITTKLAELKTLYPFHNRFSTAYELTFAVPATRVEQGPSSLTITSTLGSTTMHFDAPKPALD